MIGSLDVEGHQVRVPGLDPWAEKRCGRVRLAADHWRRWASFHRGLVPYLLEAAREYVETGTPLMRHMCLVNGGPDRSDQYMLGPDLLVAPVLVAGAREREVALPPGTWQDMWRGTNHEGGRTVVLAAPLEEIPILKRIDTAR
jgi:alpha-D-xyloside xylohydrolase